MLKEYNKETLKEDLTSNTPTYLYFHLPGCKPCKRITPLVEQFAQVSNINVYKLQTEDDPELVRSLKIGLYPTMVGVQNTETIFIAEGSNRILERLV